jgi:hypothetical protein
MRHLLIVGLLVLTAATSSAHGAPVQQLAPHNSEPITIQLAGTTFEDAIGFVARHAGIEVQFDDTATIERRNTRLTLNLTDVTLEEALDAMTRLSGLSYAVADAKTIRVYQLP